MIYIQFILLSSVSKIDPGESGKLQGITAKKFAVISWGALIILLITGFLKTPNGMLLNTSTLYGIILFIKHILVFCMILVGIMIGVVVVPRIKKNMPAPGEKPKDDFLKSQRRLNKLAKINLLFGIFVLIRVSLL